MKFIPRAIGNEVKNAARAFPALLVTGPRRSGKTTLLKRVFPKAAYHLFEDTDVIARVRSDPRGFLEDANPPAILDEIQNVPELLNYLRTRIDRAPHRYGQWYLTGSQEAPLMKGVSESMAGRLAVFQLLPLSTQETSKVSLLRGGFPEALAHPAASNLWFRSYIQTYLERDVRALSAIKDLAAFRRFLSILASRSGRILNKTDLAAPLGVSVPTISEWLSILEITGQIILVYPFYENLGKRLIKSPKIYFVDSGLLCHLLGIETEKLLHQSLYLGPLFEGFAASEIVKSQINSGKRRELYYFRDQQGLEVDFLIPRGGRRLTLLEIKASRTVKPEAALPIERLSKAVSAYETEKWVVHLGPSGQDLSGALRPGIRTLPLEDFLKSLQSRRPPEIPRA